MPLAGEVINDKFTLVEKLGEGGMGSVWSAKHNVLEREVAVKFLHKTLVTDPESIVRFHNEARAASRLAHSNICHVLDVGCANDVPFLVMERLRGHSLADRLQQLQSVTPEQAVQIVVQILYGLKAAHQAGIIHRDLKPENIFLVHQDSDLPQNVTVKLLDFGVAKIIGDDAARIRLTRAGNLVGTPAYMSPEQALGSDTIDCRADLWSVGVILYELLANRLPYDAANYTALLVKITTEEPLNLKQVAPHIDPSLATIVHTALNRKPSKRFQSAELFAQALTSWLERSANSPSRRVHHVTPRSSSTPAVWAESQKMEYQDTLQNLHAPHPSKRWWLTPALIAVVVGGSAVLIVRGAQKHQTTAHAQTNNQTREPLPAPLPPVEHTPVQPALPRISVSEVPSNATIRVNGQITALPVQVPLGSDTHIEITVPGREPWQQSLRPTGDVSLRYQARELPPDTTHSSDAGTIPSVSVTSPDGGVPSRNNSNRNTNPRRNPTLPRGVAREPDM